MGASSSVSTKIATESSAPGSSPHPPLKEGATPSTGCPFADLSLPITLVPKGDMQLLSPLVGEEVEGVKGCPFHAHARPATQTVFTAPPKNTNFFGDHAPSAAVGEVLRDIGGGDRIRESCTRFYARMHVDARLKEFLFMHDGVEAHAKRLGDWIIEEAGGEGTPWTDSGRRGVRQATHAKAWTSPARPKHHYGRRFNLSDCRVWMRLFFWGARECGLNNHRPFWTWFIAFIAHFVAVYERKAPPYAAESAEWSATQSNIDQYFARGNRMEFLDD